MPTTPSHGASSSEKPPERIAGRIIHCLRGGKHPANRVRPSLALLMLSYGCAVASTVLATGVRLLLDPMLGDQFPFTTAFAGAD